MKVDCDYIGIIDGLKPTDRIAYGITDALKKLLEGAGIKVGLVEVASKGELLGALVAFRVEAVAGRRFMLHFVFHGNSDGVQAGSDFVDWNAMAPFFQQLHDATNITLILNMSTCQGVHGVKMVANMGAYPFFGIIGAKQELVVQDAINANRIMYSKMINGVPIQKLVPETNAELQKEVLYNISSEGFRKLSAK